MKLTKKKLEAEIWTKRAKIGQEISFSCHFLKFSLLVFPENAYNDSLQ